MRPTAKSPIWLVAGLLALTGCTQIPLDTDMTPHLTYWGYQKAQQRKNHSYSALTPEQVESLNLYDETQR